MKKRYTFKIKDKDDGKIYYSDSDDIKEFFNPCFLKVQEIKDNETDEIIIRKDEYNLKE